MKFELINLWELLIKEYIHILFYLKRITWDNIFQILSLCLAYRRKKYLSIIHTWKPPFTDIYRVFNMKLCFSI